MQLGDGFVANRAAICDSRNAGRSDTQRAIRPWRSWRIPSIPPLPETSPSAVLRNGYRSSPDSMSSTFTTAMTRRRRIFVRAEDLLHGRRDGMARSSVPELNAVAQPGVRELAPRLTWPWRMMRGARTTARSAPPAESPPPPDRKGAGIYWRGCPATVVRAGADGNDLPQRTQEHTEGIQRTDEARFHCESVHAIVLTELLCGLCVLCGESSSLRLGPAKVLVLAKRTGGELDAGVGR